MTSLCAIIFLLATPAFAQTVGGGQQKLHQWDGQGFIDRLGSSVSNAGDVNGDGFADVIAGAYGADPGGLADAGSAYVYSGADGSLLYQWDGGAAVDLFGLSVSGAGDINGDGFADLIVGAFAADPGGLASAGSAYAYSGVDGSLLYQWDGGAGLDFFGTSVSDAGDVNGDGSAEAQTDQANNSDDLRNYFDVVADIRLCKQLSLNLNAVYGSENNATGPNTGNNTWWGFSGIARYDVNDWFSLNFRGQTFHDQDGARSGTIQKLWAMSLTPEVRINSNMVVRAEYRHDESDSTSFTDRHGNGQYTQNTLAFNALFYF